MLFYAALGPFLIFKVYLCVLELNISGLQQWLVLNKYVSICLSPNISILPFAKPHIHSFIYLPIQLSVPALKPFLFILPCLIHASLCLFPSVYHSSPSTYMQPSLHLAILFSTPQFIQASIQSYTRLLPSFYIFQVLMFSQTDSTLYPISSNSLVKWFLAAPIPLLVSKEEVPHYGSVGKPQVFEVSRALLNKRLHIWG